MDSRTITPQPGSSIRALVRRFVRVTDVRISDARVPNARVPNARVPNARVPNARVPNARVPNVRVPNVRVSKDRFRSTDGFTLVELLVVIAIIGMLVAILLPAVNSVRTNSRAMECRNNLRQTGLAVILYSESRDGRLPAQWKSNNPNPVDNFSWAVDILSYLEEGNIRDRLDLTALPLDPVNQTAVSSSINVFECPATPSSPRIIHELGFGPEKRTGIQAAGRDFVAVHSVPGADGRLLTGIWSGAAVLDDFSNHDQTGLGPGFPDDAETPEFGGGTDGRDTFNPTVRTLQGSFTRVTDGLSNTVLLVEQAAKPEHYLTGFDINSTTPPTEGAWATAELNSFNSNGVNVDNYSDPYGFHHGAHVSMADGSVHLWSIEIDANVMRGLLSSNGGEIVNPKDL